ncbi:MAG: 30S ribosomal protein S7, partial [Candidatus Micrarchaeia archaeon]
ASEAKAPKVESESKASKKLFGKYALDGIVITDQSLAKYMTSPNKEYPNIFGRRKYNSYYTTHISIIERFVNKLMRGGTGRKIGGTVIRTEGRLQGKKIKVMHIVEDAFDIIYERTKQNPLQVFVSAIEHSVPIEDTTRVRYGGITYNVAVDISSTRRINVTLKNLALAAITKAFQNKKKLSDSIADEIILAASGSPESYAIKKKAEMTRMARSAR